MTTIGILRIWPSLGDTDAVIATQRDVTARSPGHSGTPIDRISS